MLFQQGEPTELVKPNDGGVSAFENSAREMLARMDLMLESVRGVSNETDPKRKLEILEAEMSGLAPDAATFISYGDSLVLDVHSKDFVCAEKLSLIQDKLRAKWSQVMAETEVSSFTEFFMNQ